MSTPRRLAPTWANATDAAMEKGGEIDARSSASAPGPTSSRRVPGAGRRVAAGHDGGYGASLMAGTMPHAIFVETGLDGGATVAAYAAELPGCATFAAADAEAVAAMPRRVARFSEWLRRNDEPAPAFVGDNWYEVDRAACDGSPTGRAA